MNLHVGRSRYSGGVRAETLNLGRQILLDHTMLYVPVQSVVLEVDPEWGTTA